MNDIFLVVTPEQKKRFIEELGIDEKYFVISKPLPTKPGKN